MRPFIRKCLTLVVALVVILALSFYALPSRGVSTVPRFEFLGHALHHTSGTFDAAHEDSTGGWLMQWFRAPSGLASHGSPQHPPSTTTRCPVYTYVDTSVHRRGSDEFAILLSWVRAFWALGFTPVILTERDARKHTRYNIFRARGLVSGSKQYDYSKWLAMAQHGGLFVDYRSIPMPSQGDIKFIEFQRCNFQELTAYQSTGERVVHGAQQYFEDIVRAAQDPSDSSEASGTRSPLESMRSRFIVRQRLEGIASYSDADVAEQFPNLTPSLLSALINAHLHEHFLREHPIIAVIDPIEGSRSNLFRQEMTSLARLIATCPSSPLPRSCPPGISHCTPCKSATVTRYRSAANIPHNAFILVAVPHPLTYLSYIYKKPVLDPQFVIDTRREEWVMFVTGDLATKRAGGYQRTQILKDFVRSESNAVSEAKEPSGFWCVWEEVDLEGLSLVLGFHAGDLDIKSQNSNSRADSSAVTLIAKEHVVSQNPDNMRDVVESWNLAWSELWYFVRASQWRRKSEQLDLMGSFNF